MTEQLTRHTLSLLLDGDVREDTFEGRPHLVAPVTAVREMVLGGENGELLPAEEIQASADLWEGTILTIGHPPQNANHRHVAEAHGVGRLFNVTANGELRGEMWIDLTRVEDVEGAKEAVEKLREGGENGEPTLEVSTAYLAAFDPKPGRHDGTRYTGVQRGIIPEHLALLPDATGECSITDGCGAPRRNDREGDVDETTLFQRGLDYLSRAFDGLSGRDNQEVSQESRREMLENAISEQFGGEDRFTWVRATFGDEVVFALEDPGDEVGLFRVGYQIDEEAGTVELTGDPVEVRETVSFEPVENQSTEEGTMDRQEMIERLENAEAFGFSREQLESFEDAQLVSLSETLPDEEDPDGADPDGASGDDPDADGDDEPAPVSQNADLGPEDAAFVRELREAGAEPEAVARAVARMNAEADEEAEEREALIERLNSSEDCELTRDELEGLRTETLQSLAKPAARRNYLGRGGVRSGAGGQSYFDENPTTPAIVTRKPAKRDA